MKRNLLWLVCLAMTFTGCRDYLTEIEPGTTLLGDFFTSTAAAMTLLRSDG